jgi:hypothetical protein
MKLRILPTLITLIFSIGNACAATLDQTGVGRFGAGHAITANTASQNLLTWNVVNTGRDIEVRLYDPDGNPLTLGHCGLPLTAGQEVYNVVQDIGWTQLTCRFTTAHDRLDILESLLTPVLWLRTDSTSLMLFQPGQEPDQAGKRPETQALALPLDAGITISSGSRGYDRVRDGRLARPWFLVLVRQGAYRVPVVCLLHNAPESIEASPSGGIIVRWPEGHSENTVGLLPLFGCRPADQNLTVGWEQGLPKQTVRQIDTLATWFLHLPIGMRETYRLTTNAVQIVNTLRFAEVADDWGWSGRMPGYALVPPALANAFRNGYPVTFSRSPTDLACPLFLAPLMAVGNTRTLIYSLPLPQPYQTIYSPVTDSTLETALPAAVRQTIRDYSRYVVQTYATKTAFEYDGSAIGEARCLASEYPCIRLMSPAAHKAFTRWADRTVSRLYDRKGCYGYGSEVANGRRFLLDNYRIGGKDYIDAGWFGYDILAMWARAHYGGHWEEVRRNWPWIRELFYGWGWTYSDYAVLCTPLYVDALNGGNPKGYTDNMAMLPAMAAWARMADCLGDRQMLRDALYMLARERVARFNRMTIYAYTRSCGFHTDVNYLPSDMWDGPNIAPSGRFIPTEAQRQQTGAMVDFGGAAAGLWFLTGSFFEPVSPETMDMILTGDMRQHVADSVETMNRRFPRWWASPGAGEMANYQVYLRGVLFHTDPALLRYYADYQDGFQQGVWEAEAWHADAFAGIVLSGFHGLEYRDRIAVQRRVGESWQPVKAEVEWNLLFAGAGRRFLTLWNTTAAPLEVQIRLPRHDPNLPVGTGVRDLKRQRWLPLASDGTLRMKLLPGSNVLAFAAPSARPEEIEVRSPASLVALSGTQQAILITLTNHSRSVRHCRVQVRGFAFDGESTQNIQLSPGQAQTLHGVYTAPNDFREPFPLECMVTADNKTQTLRTKVLLLPAVVALLNVEGSKVVRAPGVGTAHVTARNRLAQPIHFDLSWSLNGRVIAQQPLSLKAYQGAEWNIPLRATNVPPGRYGLTVTVQGQEGTHQEQTSNIVLLPPQGMADAPPVLLYGFEQDIEGWNLPDWPDANKNDKGQVVQPICSDEESSEGHRSLKMTFHIAPARASQGFVGVHPLSDWTMLRRVRMDVYLPPNAPAGLTAHFYMMQDGWHWRESTPRIALKPGQWTTLETPLVGSGVAAEWGCSEKEFRAGLPDVLDFGIRIGNEEPNRVGYSGPVYIDNVRAEAD